MVLFRYNFIFIYFIFIYNGIFGKKTIINYKNIHDLVEKYIYNKDGLPADLKIKKNR
jgi:hypothetical protein